MPGEVYVPADPTSAQLHVSSTNVRARPEDEFTLRLLNIAHLGSHRAQPCDVSDDPRARMRTINRK